MFRPNVTTSECLGTGGTDKFALSQVYSSDVSLEVSQSFDSPLANWTLSAEL